MNPIRRFEKSLKQYEDKNQHRAGQNFFTKYAILKERLTNTEYTQAIAGFPGGNDHGPQHIERVLDYLDSILGTKPLKHINIYELFLAAMSILYHDVGILLGRQSHAGKSAWFLSLESNDYVMSPLDKELMGVAVFLHSSSKKIEEVCQNYHEYPTPQEVNGHNVRIHTVAALVRIADEMDEDNRRAPRNLQDKLDPPAAVPSELGEVQAFPEISKFYWAFNQRVRGVGFDVNIRTVKMQMKFQPGDQLLNYTQGDSEKSFVFSCMEKITKLNDERLYCNKFLPEGLHIAGLELSIIPTNTSPAWRHPFVRTLTGKISPNDIFSELPEALRKDEIPVLDRSCVSSSVSTGLVSSKPLSSSIRRAPTAKAIVGLGSPTKDAWLKLLEVLKIFETNSTYKIVAESLHQNSVEIAVQKDDTRHLVRCLGGRGFSISISLVNEENARLDDDEYSSIIVLSLGDIEEEARQKALRLLAKGKNLRFLAKDQLIEELGKTMPQPLETSIGCLDGTTSSSRKSVIADQVCGTDQMDRENRNRNLPKPDGWQTGISGLRPLWEMSVGGLLRVATHRRWRASPSLVG